MIYNNPRPGEWVYYRCSFCKQRYRYTTPKESCAVMHYGRGCCHYGEEKIEND